MEDTEKMCAIAAIFDKVSEFIRIQKSVNFFQQNSNVHINSLLIFEI